MPLSVPKGQTVLRELAGQRQYEQSGLVNQVQTLCCCNPIGNLAHREGRTGSAKRGPHTENGSGHR